MSILLPPPSPILAMAKRAAERKAAGHDVIDLTLGEPDFSAPQHVIAAAHGDNAFYLIVEGTTQQEITEYWGQLISDGEIIQPLGPSQWSPLYGMLKDQFGVVWALSIQSSSLG